MTDQADKFMLDDKQVRDSFGRAAGSYEQSAVLQREVGNRLFERLEIVSETPGRILDAGCGTGYFTDRLLEEYPHAEVVAVDIAPQMLEVATGKIGANPRFLGQCENIESMSLETDSIDLVFCNLVVQWCNDPYKAFREFSRVLKPGGWLLVSSFGPDTLKELRSAWQAADDFNHVNRFIDMHDLGDALVRAGFREPVMDMEPFTLTYDTVIDLMHDLKAIGAHNLTAGRPHGLTGKHRFAEMQRTYEAFRVDSRLPASYEVLYGSAWVPQGKHAALDADGEFSLEEMQRMLKEHSRK